MDGSGVKYNERDARDLAQRMQYYEEQIMQLANECCNLSINAGSQWHDAKYNDFYNLLYTVIGDIETGYNVMRDYREHLEEKIKELSG